MRGDQPGDAIKFNISRTSGSRRRCTWLPALGSLTTALLLFLWIYPKNAVPHPGGVEVNSHSIMSPQVLPPDARSETLVKKNVEAALVSMKSLRGPGLSVQKFVELLTAVSSQSVHWESPDLAARAAQIRLSDYDGDELICTTDALDLLTFCGLTVEAHPPNSFIIHEMTSEDQCWQLLASKVDPDGPNWGALRPWRALRFRDQRTLESILEASRAASPEDFNALVWAVGGSDRALKIEEDGLMHWESGRLPDELQLSAISTRVEELRKSTTYAGDPRFRAAVANVLGAMLHRNSTVQLQFDHPALVTLGSLLTDSNVEVACSAALALGQSASVSGIKLLVNDLEREVIPPEVLTAILTGLYRAEVLGRRLDSDSLGFANWETRRELFAQVSSWVTVCARKVQPEKSDLVYAAAWLHEAEQFAPDMVASTYGDALRATLEKSDEPRAQWIASEFAGRTRSVALEPLTGKLQSGCVAGPLCLSYRFNCTLAHQLLSSSERRSIQAALWRLNQPESLQPDFGIDNGSLQYISNSLVSIAQSNDSTILRNLALATLYRERRTQTAETKYWRLNSEPGVALSIFLNDTNLNVQLTAASVLSRLGGPSEILTLARKDLTDRSPESLEMLLTGLVPRVEQADEQAESLTPAFIGLAQYLLQSTSDTVATRAAWARMHDPNLDTTSRIRLLKSFRSPLKREAAVRALAETTKRDALTPKMIGVLLADEDPRVRAAVISSGLARELKTK